MILPCYYNAPVSWYAMLMASDEPAVIEVQDHYTKQTYRNRCRILGANGVIDLVIPVAKAHGEKTPMEEVKIDDDPPWQKIHWRSIFSAYASAPFFEFMADAYQPVYEKRYRYLADLNLDLVRITLDQLQLKRDVSTSREFTHPASGRDLQEIIHPKREFRHPDLQFKPVNYHQVFADRHGFQEDLSLIDLLFNEGPNAVAVLQRSIRSRANLS